MQMAPIISEVYNRSINLLTGRKGSGRVAASQLAGVARPPPPMPRRALARARSLTTGLHTTVDKCSLLAYHLYAWGFVLSLAGEFSRLFPFIGTRLRALRTSV